MPVKGWGGGLKALADMSAENLIFVVRVVIIIVGIERQPSFDQTQTHRDWDFSGYVSWGYEYQYVHIIIKALLQLKKSADLRF